MIKKALAGISYYEPKKCLPLCDSGLVCRVRARPLELRDQNEETSACRSNSRMQALRVRIPDGITFDSQINGLLKQVGHCEKTDIKLPDVICCHQGYFGK